MAFGDFTVDRNSTKYVLGSGGTIIPSATDEPAFEFNADGSYKGLLVEPAATNEARQSEDLDNATYWNVFLATIAGDTETDPKGGTNSFLLSETVDNGVHGFNIQSAYRATVSTAGETWTQSVFVKKGDGANAPDIVQLTHALGAFGTQYANFDISVGGGTSGTVTDSSGGTAGIRYYGNGWYRISWTSTSTGSGVAFVSFLFTNNNPTAGRATSYAGQTDANVFVWGAQLETGPIATSYIPTTTASVTRVKDDITLGSASSLIGQTEGTIYVEVDWRETSGVLQYLLSANDDSVNNRIAIRKTTGDSLNMLAVANNVTLTDQGESSSSYSGAQKLAFAYANNDFALYRNGSPISFDTSGSLAALATLTNIDLGQAFNTSAQANMWIRAVSLYPKRLSAAQLAALTGSAPRLIDSYSGAAAAYSLRNLSTSTTNVVKVRRSGDDAELDFTADEVSDGTLAAWVVAGGGTEDGFVTTWYDQSGNANNATQATAANQPKIVDSGSVITQGSKPIIKFVDNDFLLSAAFSVSVNRTYVMTLYSATNTNTSFKGYLTFNNGYLDNFINGLVGAANTSNVVTSWVADGSANTRVGTTALTDGNYYLLSVLVEGGVQHQHYRNGVLNAENTSLSISPETASRVLDILKTGTTGNDLRTNEAIIWDSYQSANRTGIEANINDYYNIYP